MTPEEYRALPVKVRTRLEIIEATAKELAFDLGPQRASELLHVIAAKTATIQIRED